MNQEKMGMFIAELRKSKNLTQYELADLIPITRDAVSKWERGKRCPEPECLIKLSEIFEVSINELLFGERTTNNNSNDIEEVPIKIYEERNKKQKTLKWLIISIILLIFSFLIYYFVNTYNSLKVYLVTSESDKIKIEDGMLVMTNEKIYFNLGNISSDSNIMLVELFYKDKENQEIFVVKTDNTNIVFHDYKGYNAYFDFKDIKYIVKNLYLKVSFDEKEEVIKLSVDKNFSNDSLFSNQDNIFTSEAGEQNYNIEEIETKIINKLSCNESFCDNTYDDYQLTYLLDSRILYISSLDEIKYEWTYSFENKQLTFQEYDDAGDLIIKYISSEDMNKCEIGNCKNIKSKLTIFQNIVNSFN